MVFALLKIGNSRAVLSVHGKLHAWPSKKFKPTVLLKHLPKNSDLYFSSVVPRLSVQLKSKLKKRLQIHEIRLKDLPIKAAYSSVGVDRLLNIMGAQTFTKSNLVVIDLGTAMTIDFYHSQKKIHLGGWIIAGPHLMAKALEVFTAKLPFVKPDPEDWSGAALGRNTRLALSMGQRAFVRGMINQAKSAARKIFGARFEVVITGGGANLLKGCSERVEDDLWIRALKQIVQKKDEYSKTRRANSRP